MSVATISVIAALVPISIQAASAQATEPKAGNLSQRLDQLADAAAVTTSAAAEDKAIGLPTSGPGSLLRRPDGTFLANARLTSVDAATEARLARAGARVTATSAADHLVTLAMDADAIDAVAAVEGVEWMEEVLTPEIHRTNRDRLAAALQEGGAGTSAACSSRVISEGDTQLGAATARTTYGVDGTGIKVGVLSDSYNNLGGAATDVANGELPGTGNPCGRTTPVVVQSDLSSGGTDEARAMAQAVHDLAPGATIMVASAFNGDVDFANQIRTLASSGAKVIVDDISYFNEPMYQDGIIAKAVADVTAAGVTYFSSAANSNIVLGGKNVASYESLQYRPTTCPAGISSSYGETDCHDFDPGAGADGGDLLNVSNGGSLVLKLGWSEAQYNIDTDLDLFLVDNSSNSVVAKAYVDNKYSSQQAYELLSYTNSSGSAKTYRLVVGRYHGNTIPQFKVIFLSGSGLTSVQWNTSSGSDVVGPTGYGHNMMRGAGSVAAIAYNTTSAPETYSSRGPATYCFNPVNGTTAATALSHCETSTVSFTATDGAANSFFGSSSGGVWRFYGTSQAAPHAAAIAALQLQAQPCRPPADILAAQKASAVAIGSYDVDSVGAGRLNASAAISNLTSCIALPTAPTNVTGTPGVSQVSLSWTTPSSPGGSPIVGYRVTPYVYGVAQATQSFASTATSQTVTGLTNGTPYTFKVAAYSAAGTGTWSAESATITPRTIPGAPTNVIGSAGNASVSLEWVAPDFDGGSPITGYTVTPYIGATAQTPRVFNSSSSIQTITGLTNNTTYTFKVKATNAAGTGPDSAASASYTPIGTATAPTNVSGIAGTGQVTLTWIAPVSDGGSPITGYIVTPYIGAGGQTPVEFDSTATTQTVTGLLNGTTYTFTVAALTANGMGPESSQSAPITPRNVPGPPTSVNGVPGDGQVVLSWTAPASNGGAPVTVYTVTPYIGASSQGEIVFGSSATTQTITGLTNGMTYTFRVKATNAAGTGSDSIPSPGIMPTGPPTAPTDVAGTPGNAQVTLTWSAPSSNGGSPLTGYVVTPYVGGIAQTPVTFTTTDTTQTITGLTNGTAYTFKVKATNAAGPGADSDASAPITPRTVPDAPSKLTAIAGDASVALSWAAPAFDGGSAITGYTVTPYIGATAQTPRVFATADTAQAITGLTNGTTYTFTVKATNVAGTSVESPASDPATPRTLPGAPTGVTGSAGNAQVSLSWTAPASNGGSAITGYRVTPYIGAVAQTPVAFASTATSQTITGLANGTAYTFKVAATNAAGTGADSTASAAITPRGAPGAPTGVTGIAGNAQVALSWTAPASDGGSAITGYTVTPYIGATAQSAVVFASNATAQTITGLTNGTAYTFTVRATNAAGTGAESTASAAVTPRTVPGAPTGVGGTAGDGQVALTWTAPASNGGSAVTGYTVTPYIGATAQSAVVFASNATAQTITGLANGTAYTFRVKATNAAGSGADSTASGSITPFGAPPAPTAVSGTPGAGQVSLTWTAPSSNGGSAITGYTVTPYIGATAQTPVVFASTATTQLITGLTNGTAYTFTVKATNAAGTGTESTASAAVTPRTVPGAPTAVSATPGDTAATVTWTAPASNGGSAITGYTVIPYIGATAQTPVAFASTATTQTISGLTNGTAYTFTVRATNIAGSSAQSDPSTAVTPRTLPSAPTGVTGTPGNTQVSLSWTAPASDGGQPITGYRVTPYIGAVAQTPVAFASTATSQTITGLTNGTAYTFKVAATTTAGTGADSTASAAITPRTVPGTPTAVTGTAGNTQVALSWTAPASNGGSAITGYTVTPYIGATAQTPVAFASTATTQTISGLTNGTAYTFTVRATNAAGTGTESTASAAVTPRTVPGAPTGVGGTAGNTQVALSWTAPASNGGSAITGYTVTPYIGATAQTPVAFASTATSQTITGLTNGTAYTFTVKATNAAGSSAESTASAALTPYGPPPAPTAVSGTPGAGQVSLTWTAPSSNGGSAITGYTVTPYIGATAQTPVVFASTATTQLITGLTNGTAYTFTVKATNAAGTGTESTASAAVTPRTVPGAPTAVSATPGDTAATVTWTAPASNGGSAITGYTVIPYIGATAQTPVAFASTATSQTISGLTNGTAYTFTVRATNIAGSSAQSDPSTPVTPRTLPSAPTGVTGTPGNTQVSLSWTAPASDGGQPITGYRVTPYIGATAQTPVAFASTATNQTITGLTNGTAYTFKVAATTTAGTGADSTASAAITPRTVPGTPTGVTGTPGDTQVSLSWTAPASDGGSAITGYTVTPYIGATAQTPKVFASTATTQTITGLTNGTAYTFTVKATNAAGSSAESTASIALTPRTLPSAPTNVGGNPGNGQVSLSWTAPASDGGQTITGYRVTPYIGATAQTPVAFASTATSQTITGLTNGTAYTFKVAATTAAGTGADSTASAAITPRTVPGAPTGVSGTAGNAQVALSWTAPASNGGSAITGYTVTPYIGATAQTPVPFATTATSQTITGLTNGTAYTFTVKATNAAGTGAESTASAAITPAVPVAPWAPFANWGAMVDRFYQDLLGRAPTASERSARIAALSNATLTPGGLVAALRLDDDNLTNVDPVARLYRAYFLRNPDKGGLAYWIRQRRVNGKKLNAISDSFAASSEFKNKYGSLTNRAFVELVYQNVLGRPGEQSGIDFWTGRLDRKVSTRGQVMTGFSESNEYKTKQASEIEVSVQYLLLLGKAPSATDFADLVARLDTGTLTPTTLAQAIIDSAAYATLIAG